MSKLNKTIGRSYDVDLDDVLNVKTALYALGYYRPSKFGITRLPDDALFEAIEDFQSGHGLRRDGVMKPDGSTVRKLAAKVDEQLGKPEPPIAGQKTRPGGARRQPSAPKKGDPDPIWGDREPEFRPIGALQRARDWARHGRDLGRSFPGGSVLGGAIGGGLGFLTGGFGNKSGGKWDRDPNFGP